MLSQTEDFIQPLSIQTVSKKASEQQWKKLDNSALNHFMNKCHIYLNAQFRT
jgi:hypothetical protein